MTAEVIYQYEVVLRRTYTVTEEQRVSFNSETHYSMTGVEALASSLCKVQDWNQVDWSVPTEIRVSEISCIPTRVQQASDGQGNQSLPH